MHLLHVSFSGLWLSIWPLAVAATTETVATEPPPNVVLVLVDDQGYYDLGCYGATEVETPRIDAMAAQGVRFTDYYAAAPICSPSRAGLLTGCYPRRVGNHIWVHRADSGSGLHPDERTLAELFQSRGYATACIGKWHLGFHEPFLPHNQGFDHYFGLLHNLDPVETVYFDQQGGVPLIRNGELVKRPADPAELTRLYTDEAIDFITRNQARPFFVYLPHTMLHNPLGVGAEFVGSSQWGEYGDAIQELDHHVGRLFDTLERLELDDNTVVIYISDNGRGPGRNPTQALRGRKLSTYEGGLRVPAIAWGPGLGIQKGVESSAVVRAMDWYPSLASLAGIKVPEDRILDGRDLSPLLKGETAYVPAPAERLSLNAAVPLRRNWDPPGEWVSLIKRDEYQDAFFYHGSQGALAAVRWEQWKLVLNPSLQLYNIVEDPAETQLVRNGPIQRKLRGMAILFQEEMRRDARLAGSVTFSGGDGRTQLSAPFIAQLHSRWDVPYAQRGDTQLTMDVFRPQAAWGALPAIICIHGGGWHKGSKLSQRRVAQYLAGQGFVTAAISYRLSGEAPFPAQVHDCKAAVRFLKAHADQLGIDADHIGAIGLSAGGHLAALLATTGNIPELEGLGEHLQFSSRIQAAVPMGAQTHLLSERIRLLSLDKERGHIWQQFLGGNQTQQLASYRSASPLEQLDAQSAPCWFVTGAGDDPSTHATLFRERSADLQLPTGLTIVPGAPHAFLGQRVWFEEALQAATDFFEMQLKPDSAATANR